MSDSSDSKSKNKQENLDAELDAMLDEAELSLSAFDNQETDDDVIDQLLVGAGFDFNEDIPSAVDNSILTADFDDDIDLADISTNPQTSDTGSNAIDEFGMDSDFPLDLLDSIENPSEDAQNALITADDDENVPIIAIDVLQDENDRSDEQIPIIKKDNFINEFDEFSDFDEFGDFHDFQTPEKNENIDTESVFSELEDTSELDIIIEQEQEPELPTPVLDENELIIDVADLAAIDDVIDFDEFSDEFDDLQSTEPGFTALTKANENNQIENQKPQDVINSESISSPDDFDITSGTDDYFNDDPDEEEQPFQEISPEDALSRVMNEETITNKSPTQSADDIASLIEAVGIPTLMQFKSDQENLNKKYKKQIADFETTSKKTSVLLYLSLGLGITAAIAAAVLGFLAYSTKADMSKLVLQLAALEQGATISSAAKAPNSDQKLHAQEPLAHPAEEKTQLEQEKTEASINEVKQEPSPVTSIHETQNSSLESKKDEHEVTSAIEKSHESSAPLKEEPVIVTKEAAHPAETKTTQPPKEATEALEKKPELSEQSSAVGTSEKQSLIVEQKKTSNPKPLEVQKTKTVINERKIKTTARIKADIGKIKNKSVSISSNWSVNLIAYKQQWYASSKATEFIQKGVPVEIIPIKINNVTWFRLRVAGFADREEASVYAGRIKKALNLSSVWVGNK